MCVLREVLLMYSCAAVICCPLFSPLPPFPLAQLPRDSLGSQEGGVCLCPLHGAFGERAGLFPGGTAWQHLPSSQVAGK